MPVICLHYGSLAFGKLTCCSFNKMCQVIGTELLLQRSPMGSIKWNSLHWNTLLCVNNKITPWGPGAAHLTLDLCVVCIVPFKLAVSINSLTEKKKIGSWHTSSGVTWNWFLFLETSLLQVQNGPDIQNRQLCHQAILRVMDYPSKQQNHSSKPLLGSFSSTWLFHIVQGQ